MDLASINGARKLAQHWLDRLGRHGVVGIGLLGFSLAFYFSALEPARTQLTALQQQSQALREQLARERGTALNQPLDPLTALYQMFPGPQKTAEILETIYSAARAHRLELNAGGYRLARKGEGKLIEYQVSLPVKGSYGQIRRFVAQALAALPAVSLDEIQLQREAVSSTTVEARLRFTVYLVGI
ncbi:MAG: type 4a pilus biogenesis protein PilO [Burkholderiales bacterium]